MFLTLFACCLISRISTSQSANEQCKPAEKSVFGKALRGHTFNTVQVKAPHECHLLCNNEKGCLSFNFVIATKLCELNNTTKEAKPSDYVSDDYRFYKAIGNKAPLGHIPEMPAASCMEITERQDGKVTSGLFWLGEAVAPFLVHCDMSRYKRGWTLIARFSNNDTRNWMKDSGEWWYDKSVTAGRTTDPSSNTDMISPALWLVSGNEIKITRSDDLQHTALLQTTGDCLGGQTFRSKIVSYGNFRNKIVWASNKCLGNCTVQYGGQYQTTEGFGRASCNGEIQSANQIGFWCDWGAGDGAVMMIGGGGSSCGRADHGIGITEANEASFGLQFLASDFGNFSASTAKSYALNLWIR